jgi:hypothetical protein
MSCHEYHVCRQVDADRMNIGPRPYSAGHSYRASFDREPSREFISLKMGIPFVNIDMRYTILISRCCRRRYSTFYGRAFHRNAGKTAYRPVSNTADSDCCRVPCSQFCSILTLTAITRDAEKTGAPLNRRPTFLGVMASLSHRSATGG